MLLYEWIPSNQNELLKKHSSFTVAKKSILWDNEMVKCVKVTKKTELDSALFIHMISINFGVYHFWNQKQ